MIPSFLIDINRERKANLLTPFFKNNEKILDFGCGDMSLSRSVKEKNPSLSIVGVDVVASKITPRNLKFVAYDGSKLPFKDKSFDAVFAFYVFHHCQNLELSLEECLRVAKKRIIIVESVARFLFEVPFMEKIDWLYNIFKFESIRTADKFLTLNQWMEIFNKKNIRVISKKKITIMPQPFFLPFGSSYIFEILINK